MDKEINNRRRGALIGLAIGDALGAAVEFRARGSFAPVTAYRAGGPHRLAAGQWTDDTSMALALADSIGKAGWDLKDQLDRYVDWWRNGNYSVTGRCFDIGTTTCRALNEYRRCHDPLRAGDPSPQASGNGSIMRLAPVPIRFYDLYPDNIPELSRLAEESSLTTHASDSCRSACRYLALVLAALLNGEEKPLVPDPEWEALNVLKGVKPLDRNVEIISAGHYKGKQPARIKGSGWVVESLEAALWAFNRASSFRDAVLEAVNLGDDADTTGAVCGQLAGAYWGESNIPTDLLDGLDRKDMIEEALESLGAAL